MDSSLYNDCMIHRFNVIELTWKLKFYNDHIPQERKRDRERMFVSIQSFHYEVDKGSF